MKTIIQYYSDFIITASAGFVVLAQYYLENIEGLVPCNLCIVQTICARGIFLIYLLKILAPNLKWLFDVVGVPVFFTGIAASGRQIYLQNLPADQLSGGYCDIPFYLIFEMYSFLKEWEKSFKVVQNVRKNHGSFLGLTLLSGQ